MVLSEPAFERRNRNLCGGSVRRGSPESPQDPVIAAIYHHLDLRPNGRAQHIAADGEIAPVTHEYFLWQRRERAEAEFPMDLLDAGGDAA